MTSTNRTTDPIECSNCEHRVRSAAGRYGDTPLCASCIEEARQ